MRRLEEYEDMIAVAPPDDAVPPPADPSALDEPPPPPPVPPPPAEYTPFRLGPDGKWPKVKGLPTLGPKHTNDKGESDYIRVSINREGHYDLMVRIDRALLCYRSFFTNCPPIPHIRCHYDFLVKPFGTICNSFDILALDAVVSRCICFRHSL